MSNLQEVLEFIKNSNDKSDLKSIYNAYAIRMSEIKNDIKNTFRVGDIVGIDLMESNEKGMIVHEINNTTEFRNVVRVTGVDIPKLMLEYVKEIA